MQQLHRIDLIDFTNVNIVFTKGVERNPGVDIRVGVTPHDGKEWPTIYVEFSVKGGYYKHLKYGKYYKHARGMDTPVTLTVSPCKEFLTDIQFVVTLGDYWEDTQTAAIREMATYISSVPKQQISRKEDIIGVGETSIILVYETNLSHISLRLKEQILANAVIWACVHSFNRIINRIEVNVIDVQHGSRTFGIEYHFAGLTETEFDKVTFMDDDLIS